MTLVFRPGILDVLTVMSVCQQTLQSISHLSEGDFVALLPRSHAPPLTFFIKHISIEEERTHECGYNHHYLYL